MKSLFIGLIVGIMVATIVVVMTSSTTCETRECFEEHADKCKPATWTATFETAVIKHKIKAGCVLEKKIIDVHPDDLESQHLIGKKLRCSYAQYDPQLIDSPIGTAECTGSLRT